MKGERLGEFEELVLLCVWNLDGEATAVPIKESLESQASRSVSLGAIYAALDRLSRKGFVDSWIGGAEPIRGGRSKRFYRVTDGGTTALREMRAAREHLWNAIERRPA